MLNLGTLQATIRIQGAYTVVSVKGMAYSGAMRLKEAGVEETACHMPHTTLIRIEAVTGGPRPG